MILKKGLYTCKSIKANEYRTRFRGMHIDFTFRTHTIGYENGRKLLITEELFYI